jgi:hypothetical protein
VPQKTAQMAHPCGEYATVPAELGKCCALVGSTWNQGWHGYGIETRVSMRSLRWRTETDQD